MKRTTDRLAREQAKLLATINRMLSVDNLFRDHLGRFALELGRAGELAMATHQAVVFSDDYRRAVYTPAAGPREHFEFTPTQANVVKQLHALQLWSETASLTNGELAQHVVDAGPDFRVARLFHGPARAARPRRGARPPEAAKPAWTHRAFGRLIVREGRSGWRLQIPPHPERRPTMRSVESVNAQETIRMFEKMIERLRTKRSAAETAATNAQARYRQLVLTQSLSSRETAELEQIVDELEITPEQLERDSKAAVAWHAARASCSAKADAQRVFTAADAAIDAHERETRKQLDSLTEERARERAKLVAAAAAARAKFKTQADGEERVASIEAEHFALFGRRDPAVVSAEKKALDAHMQKVRTIGHWTEDIPSGNSDHHMTIEALALSGNVTPGLLDRIIIAQHPDQGDEEFAHLKSLFESAAVGRLFNLAYVVPTKNEYPKLSDACRHQFVHRIEDLERSPKHPKDFTIVRHPGQSQREFEKLKARWFAAINKPQRDASSAFEYPPVIH